MGTEGQNKMDRGSEYHGYGVRYTMGCGVQTWVGGQNTMGRGSKYHG